MWNRGKDLDLTSPRARTWKYRTVETGKSSPVSVKVSFPKPQSTSGGRPAPATVASPAEDAEVLARLNGLGILGVGGVALALLVGFGAASDIFGDAWALFPLVVAIFMHRTVTAAAIGGYNLAKREGRAIWIDEGRIKAIDWYSGFVSVPLGELANVRFDPTYKRHKTVEPALLLQKSGGKTIVVGLKTVDAAGPDLVKRIRAAAPNSAA